MSGPYVYQPQVNYHNSPYLGPIINGTQYTPIIPSLSLSGSPFGGYSPLPPSPNIAPPPFIPPAANSVAFPGSTPSSTSAQSLPADAWVQERHRRPSWHGVPPLAQQPTSNGWLPAHAPYGGHQRTRSFNGGSAAIPPNFVNPGLYGGYPQQLNGYWPSPASPAHHHPGAGYLAPALTGWYVHPWLNAENPHSDLIFDLSAPDFAPMAYAGNGHSRVISVEELQQPATYPAVTYMRIETSEVLGPFFPHIDVLYDAQAGAPPPLTIGAILHVLWTWLHQPISQELWASLDERTTYQVSKAYTRRCRAMPSREMLLRNQGVKRVDFLLGKTDFKGLLRAQGVEGLERMKMIVA